MNRRIRKFCKNLALTLVYSSIFQKVMDFVLRNNLTPALKNLRDLGFEPDLILDVGAYIGDWSTEALGIFPKAQGIMFEPQKDKLSRLEQVCDSFPRRLSVQSVLLGDVSGSRDFFRLETGSSIYRENTLEQPILEKHLMKTLDHSLAGTSGENAKAILLKLDVQGAEKDILNGSIKTLKNVDVLIMELSFLRYNEGAPLAHEMIAYADQIGFVPFNICGICRIKGQFVQADLLFVRKSSRLLTAAERSFRS